MAHKKISIKEILLVLVSVVIIFSSGLLAGWNYGYLGYDIFHAKNTRQERAIVSEVYQLVSEQYDGSFNSKAESVSIIKKLLSDLHDPYSYYISKDDYQKLKQQDEGTFIGIGINYYLSDKTPIILDVYPDSPAQKLALKNGQKIVSINKIPVTNFTNESQIITALKGQKNEIVNLEIEDSGQKKNIAIKREEFTIPTFTYKKLDIKTAYLKIYQFSPYLKKDFQDIETKIKKDSMQNLIIDLRNNKGGEAGTAVFLADKFVNEGILVRERYKPENKEVAINASGSAPFTDIKLIILVNKQTASEAEVFATAIQENKRGILVGEQTYGKGIASNFYELKDGSAIRLTTGKWFTPKGNWIGASLGIKPDKVYTSEEIAKDNIIEIVRKSF